MHEVRLIPTKKDIAFVEYLDEASSGVAKDALHNYKLDGENKIKVCRHSSCIVCAPLTISIPDYIRQEVISSLFVLTFAFCMYTSHNSRLFAVAFSSVFKFISTSDATELYHT